MSIDLDALIEACYAAVAEPDHWPLVLDQVAAAVGAHGLVITNIARPLEIVASETLAEANEAYASGWWHLDSRNARGKAIGVRLGTLVLDRDLITSEEKRRDVFFQEFCRPHRLGEFAGYVAPDVSGERLSVSAFRRDRDGEYQAPEIDLLCRLAPHIARAYSLSMLLAGVRIDNINTEEVIERIKIGAIVLDGQGCVRQMNGVAKRLLPAYLRLSADRRLYTLVSAEHEKFKYALTSDLSVRGDAATSILLRGVEGRLPISIDVLPLRKSLLWPHLIHSNQSGRLVLLRDLFTPPSQSIEPQLRHLGLSQAEARVAMFVGRGRSLRETAEALAVTENTVRTQLKYIFAKLGISRQTELAIIISRIDTAQISNA